MTPSRLENTVICSFHFIKRNLRSTTGIINSKLFPTLYQRTRAWDTGPGVFTIRPLYFGHAPLWIAKNLACGQKCNLGEVAPISV